ncbi:MAG: AAA family ATPase [Isosphaeraceae bacterium]
MSERTIAALTDRLTEQLDQALGHRHGLIEDRASRGKPRDTHGDLRLDHVYLRADPDGPNVFWIVDGVEFSERLRFADPVADAAFPVMELAFAGRRDLARVFAEAYFEASGDDEGRALLPLYVSYRAAVRAKVGGLLADEAEVPEADRHEALRASRAYWLLALDAVEEPDRRPLLVLVMGLPGVGKSTLAHALAAARFDVIRSDVVQKTLATELGVSVQPAGFEQGIYAPSGPNAPTRLASIRHAAGSSRDVAWFSTRASVRSDGGRRRWRQHVPGVCRPSSFTSAGADMHQRLAARSGQGDPSDADGAIHVEAAARGADGPHDGRRVPHDRRLRRSRSDPRRCARSASGPGLCLIAQVLRILTQREPAGAVHVEGGSLTRKPAMRVASPSVLT